MNTNPIMNTTPSTPSSTSSTFSTSLFLRLPSYLISTIPSNPYTLPLYIYSALLSHPSTSSLVDTSLLHISQFFAPVHSSSHTSTSIPLIKSALLFLAQDHDKDEKGTKNFSFNEVQPNFSFNEAQPSCSFNEVQPSCSFSAPFQLSAIDSLRLTPSQSYFPTQSQQSLLLKTSRLRYYFLDHSIQFSSPWLKLTYSEIYYLLSSLESLNSTRSPQAQLSPVEVLNTYVYLKYRITYTTQLIKKYPELALKSTSSGARAELSTFHESYKTLMKKLNLGQKRLTSILKVLSELKMITIYTGNFKNNEANEYYLNNNWLKDYKE